jgi:GDSL-like Lipase/Acylhydrolase
MKRLNQLATAALVAVCAAGLAPVAFGQSTGSADFTRFVAVGDSLGSGFVSGGLVAPSQSNSVPALIFNQATGNTLTHPLVAPPGAPGLLQLLSLSPLTIAPRAGSGQPLTAPPFGNLSVPGFRIGDSLRTVTGNAIIDLVLRGRGTQLQQALAARPTFALLWLGNNDVLGAATSGLVIEGVTLTPVASFQADYTLVVNQLRAAGAKLVMATLPNVTSIPFVTTVPPVVVNPSTNQPVLGPNGAPIPLLGPGNVPLGPGDRVLLTATTPLRQGIGIPASLGGTGVGLGDQFVLSASEIATISARVEAYNAVIRQQAQASGSALVELQPVLSQAASRGINVGGVNFTSAFVTGGVFSLDGVHPYPFGYAFLANEFIKAINRTYGADIPQVDLFPFMFGVEGAPIHLVGLDHVGEFTFTEAAKKQLFEALRISTEPAATPPKKKKRGRR